MNHTLQTTKLAGAITAMALVCGLLLAEPVPRPAGAPSGTLILAAGGDVAGGPGRGLSRHLGLRARRLDGDMPAAAPAGEALAIASAAVAASVVDATVSALLEDLGTRAGAVGSALVKDTSGPARGVRSRNAMAMPYFTTASGTGRGIRE